jgi:hypothetical protein
MREELEICCRPKQAALGHPVHDYINSETFFEVLVALSNPIVL